VAKMLVSTEFISLVNLIADKEIVKELVQNELNTETLKTELSAILKTGNGYNLMLENYASLLSIMGGPGASSRIAADIVRCLNK